MDKNLKDLIDKNTLYGILSHFAIDIVKVKTEKEVAKFRKQLARMTFKRMLLIFIINLADPEKRPELELLYKNTKN